MNLTQAKQLAISLMVEHGISHWRFEFNRAKKSLGKCSYRKRVISLSVYFTELNDEKTVRNTILHEIAHALTPGHHHDEVWRRKAIEIGCNGERCYTGDVKVQGKYVAHCGKCGHEYHMHRKTRSSYLCGKCPDARVNQLCKLSFQPV